MFTEFNTLNKEAFMVILGNIWNKWATPKSIVNAVKRVGITDAGLHVGHMQQDKFLRAENCIAPSDIPSTSTPTSSFTIQSPDKRKNSAAYWKAKFEKFQQLIKELSEKSLRLEEIPGFLTIQKVKPKLSKATTRVTQVNGSMNAKNVLELVKSIKDKKEQQCKEKEESKSKKESEKETFYQCKKQYVCNKCVCQASKLLECPSCHNVQRSVCSKSACKVDGKKPTMILPAAAVEQKKVSKRSLDNEESDEGTDEIDDDSDTELCELVESESSEDDMHDPVEDAKQELLTTWKRLSPQ